jgi:hypothetical protein
VTRDQFKLLMLHNFKITDVRLATHIFLAADTKNQGALDIRDLIASIVFWLRGDISSKF